MKKKMLIVGLIALLMAGGLVFVSCSGCPQFDGCTVMTSGDGNKSYSGCSESSCASWKSYESGVGANRCDC